MQKEYKPMYTYLVYYAVGLDRCHQVITASRKIRAYTEAQAIYKFERVFEYGSALYAEKI